ncbi:MAG: phosphatase PAP2 family protein, partial [Acidobacteria bacterium]|nr:phosphatase PAP2 family protein [Acidobacteriota bacterium]
APAPTAEDAAEAKAAAPYAGFDPMSPGSFGHILKSDLKAAPGKLWSGTKHSFANPVNLLVLSAAFGADRIVRHNLDSDVREEFRDDDSSLAETGDFGSVIGNPALHFGVAGAWYAVAVRNRDARQHELSKTLFEALAVNGLSTVLLKVSMNDRAPNDEKYGWPSGHTSSSVCFAAVMHEYYGLKAGLPLYALAGYSAATRLEDGEHDLSDLVFGAALGWVVGHSVVKGELPQVAGFTVLPYGGASAGGLMLVKQW